jgi:hypothetical protein
MDEETSGALSRDRRLQSSAEEARAADVSTRADLRGRIDAALANEHVTRQRVTILEEWRDEHVAHSVTSESMAAVAFNVVHRDFWGRLRWLLAGL